MEIDMKKITLTFVLIFMIAGSSFSKEKPDSIKSISSLELTTDKSLQHGAINYYTALNRNNEGIIESAITNIMIMKLYFPERNYDNFIAKLTELNTEGKSKQIRYKSYIACNYLKHPERYTWINKDSFKNTIELFNQFSEKLAKQLEKAEDSLLVLSN
jgi:hypothetical protein